MGCLCKTGDEAWGQKDQLREASGGWGKILRAGLRQ